MENNVIELFPRDEGSIPDPVSEWVVMGTTAGKLEEIVRYVDKYVPEERQFALLRLIEEYAGLNGADAYRAGYSFGQLGEKQI